MINSKSILGADIGEKTITLSCCTDQQKELINETYPLKEDRVEEEIAAIVKQFLDKNHMGMKPSYLIYSCENRPLSLCRRIERKLKGEGIGLAGTSLISREIAFVHYVMEQSEELYKHTAFAFSFDGKELCAYRLFHPNRKAEKELQTEKRVLEGFCPAKKQTIDGAELDQRFAHIAKQILTKEVVSAVFLTGQGFEGGWMKQSLSVLCDGRRAFFGQNLFSAGCCYYGVRLCKNEQPDYFIQAPETVLYESGVTDSGTKDSFVKITEAGSAWYETKGSMDVVLERGGKADIVFVHTHTKEKQVESVDLSSLGQRPRKTGRLRIQVEFTGRNKGVITVCDKGFGAFVPATHQVFLKEFELLLGE